MKIISSNSTAIQLSDTESSENLIKKRNGTQKAIELTFPWKFLSQFRSCLFVFIFCSIQIPFVPEWICTEMCEWFDNMQVWNIIRLFGSASSRHYLTHNMILESKEQWSVLLKRRRQKLFFGWWTIHSQRAQNKLKVFSLFWFVAWTSEKMIKTPLMKRKQSKVFSVKKKKHATKYMLLSLLLLIDCGTFRNWWNRTFQCK